MYKITDIEDKGSAFKATIDPGVEEVTILETTKESVEDGKTPYYTTKMENLTGNKDFVFKNYLAEKAMPYNLSKAKHIAMNCLNENELAKISGETHEELMVNILNACEGKKIRILFIGKEYINNDGKIAVRTEIGLPTFAENINIPAEKSALKFNKDSKYHFEKLPDEVRAAATESEESAEDKLNKIKF